jgi:hypothetical protein
MAKSRIRMKKSQVAGHKLNMTSRAKGVPGKEALTYKRSGLQAGALPGNEPSVQQKGQSFVQPR